MWVCVFNTWQVTVPHDAEFCVFSAYWKCSIGLETELKCFHQLLEHKNSRKDHPGFDKHLLKLKSYLLIGPSCCGCPQQEKYATDSSCRADDLLKHLQVFGLQILSMIVLNNWLYVVIFFFYFKHGSVQIFICSCGGTRNHARPSWFCPLRRFLCCTISSRSAAFLH